MYITFFAMLKKKSSIVSFLKLSAYNIIELGSAPYFFIELLKRTNKIEEM